MENIGRRAPREAKIRRAIVVLSSWQSALGAVIIAMSFTVFACSSSERIRNACPYWAGFTVLFTGSVGFLTWKQLSIISIGIYTFLSAVSVIVHLVGTVLTGDCAGFLRSLRACVEVKFEHACGCCVVNDSCKLPYKFSSVRDCSILNGLLKDLMYGLCAINVICCLICLGITVMGCTLVAQYNHYNQTFGLRWHRSTGQPPSDHGYNWLAFPSDPSDFIPPCAPPIYYPRQSNREDVETRSRRPPTVFDPVDFPPPYSSREPSLSGRQPVYGLDTSLVSSRQSSVEGGVELESDGQGGETRSRESGSCRSEGDRESSIRSISCIPEDDASHQQDTSREASGHEERLERVGENEGRIGVAGCDDLYRQVQLTSHSQGSMQINSRASSSSVETNTNKSDCGTNHEGMPSDQPRGHLCLHNPRLTQSDEVYRHHDEVYQGVIAHNINPWSEAISDQAIAVEGSSAAISPLQLRRANSIPNCTTEIYRELSTPLVCQAYAAGGETRSANDVLESSVVDPGKQSTDTEELGNLFRNFKESKATKASSKSRRRRRRRRPRNNPGHILEREAEKEGCIGINDMEADCRETTL